MLDINPIFKPCEETFNNIEKIIKHMSILKNSKSLFDIKKPQIEKCCHGLIYLWGGNFKVDIPTQH